MSKQVRLYPEDQSITDPADPEKTAYSISDRISAAYQLIKLPRNLQKRVKWVPV